MSARLVFQRIERIGDMAVACFDAELPSGGRVALAGFRDRYGHVVIGGLWQILDREAQNAAAGAIRAALEADAGHETASAA